MEVTVIPRRLVVKSLTLLTLLDEVYSIVMLEFAKMALPYCSWSDSIKVMLNACHCHWIEMRLYELEQLY